MIEPLQVSVCEDYVGFLKPTALCSNCGAPCIEHELPFELYVRLHEEDDFSDPPPPQL